MTTTKNVPVVSDIVNSYSAYTATRNGTSKGFTFQTSEFESTVSTRVSSKVSTAEVSTESEATKTSVVVESSGRSTRTRTEVVTSTASVSVPSTTRTGSGAAATSSSKAGRVGREEWVWAMVVAVVVGVLGS